MIFTKQFKEDIFHTNPTNFEDKALEVFQYQARQNEVYKSYLQFLKINPSLIQKVEQIPFLPIEFFKTHKVVSGNVPTQVIFESSGTTDQVRSKHHVADLDFYNQITEHIFEQFYGKLEDYDFFALLPSYAERDNSSLIYMVNHFMSKSKHQQMGFYLNNERALIEALKSALQKSNSKIILIGVTFALLDLADKANINLSGIEIMETGGMKGRRKELVREEVHQILTQRFSVPYVGSEYGMTELLSQGYAKKDGIFHTPEWVKIMLRNVNDPFEKGAHIQRGGINVIDLANIDTCSFIETKDLGSIYPNGGFNILGRFDNSDLRGCNLLLS